MAMKQEIYSEMRGEKSKDITKHRKSQKVFQSSTFYRKKIYKPNKLK